MKREKIELVKLELHIIAEFTNYGLVKDIRGHFWRLPWISSDGRKYKLNEIKPFIHKTYIAINYQNRIISIDRLMEDCKTVKRKQRFMIDIKKVPEDLKKYIL